MKLRPTVRPLQPGDDDAIAHLFDDTVLLGSPLERLPVVFDHYRALSLGWYLGPGRADAAVATDTTNEVVGYTLVCTDERAAARAGRRDAATLALRVAAEAARGHLDASSRAFYRARARDARALVLTRKSPPAPVHAHLNVRSGARTFSVARALVDHIDTRCRLAGHDAWYGELNERDGSRAGALERLGAEIVSTVPNHTLSGLLGEPVRRLTLVRHLPDADVRWARRDDGPQPSVGAPGGTVGNCNVGMVVDGGPVSSEIEPITMSSTSTPTTTSTMNAAQRTRRRDSPPT